MSLFFENACYSGKINFHFLLTSRPENACYCENEVGQCLMAHEYTAISLPTSSFQEIVLRRW